jgi:adenosylcobinamide-GDP ribazoletransferase
VIAVVVLVAATGAMHQDGLADCADGLGVRWDRERRLEVMRDSSIGAFGALALILWLMLLVVALAGLARRDAALALVVAVASGRWAAVVHAAATPPARRDGLGAGFAVGPAGLALATAVAVAVDLGVAGPARGLAAVAVAGAVGLLVSVWSRRALGGRTGDTLGVSVVLAEVAVVVFLLGLAGGST